MATSRHFGNTRRFLPLLLAVLLALVPSVHTAPSTDATVASSTTAVAAAASPGSSAAADTADDTAERAPAPTRTLVVAAVTVGRDHVLGSQLVASAR